MAAVCFSFSRPATCALNLLRAQSGATVLQMSSVLAHDFPVLHHVQAIGAPPPLTAQVRCLSTQKEIDDNLKKYAEGKFDSFPDPGHLEHFKERSKPPKPVAEDAEVVDASSIQGDQQVAGSPAAGLGRDSHSITSQQGPQQSPELPMGSYTLPHPIWSEDQLHDVKITHKPPEGIVDKCLSKEIEGM
ncbi:uncharacterized protein LOC143290077 [Babylonia areolata]|uniref:uncharacterized protein LOC143290077 n=1 Tax=Babylonia areolata TaxID=304850 RepID=UPI003FD25544